MMRDLSVAAKKQNGVERDFVRAGMEQCLHSTRTRFGVSSTSRAVMSEQYFFQRSNFHRQQSTDRKAKTPFRGFRFKEATGLIQPCTQAA
jgi:hypothetical protein